MKAKPLGWFTPNTTDTPWMPHGNSSKKMGFFSSMACKNCECKKMKILGGDLNAAIKFFFANHGWAFAWYFSA